MIRFYVVLLAAFLWIGGTGNAQEVVVVDGLGGLAKCSSCGAQWFKGHRLFDGRPAGN